MWMKEKSDGTRREARSKEEKSQSVTFGGVAWMEAVRGAASL